MYNKVTTDNDNILYISIASKQKIKEVIFNVSPGIILNACVNKCVYIGWVTLKRPISVV